MKRLGIFCFYDDEGIVDSYIEYLLQELKNVINDLIIVVNGKVGNEGKLIFSKFASKIIFRTNKGFDVGAYAEVLRYEIGNNLYEWDELVLCNDTFYGPFVPMRDIFTRMSDKNIDFWGLNIVERGLLDHIQSYFLVFRKKILISGELNQYFINNINTREENIANVCATFEPGLFDYLIKKGYTYSTYTNTHLCSIYKSAHICIERYDLPILKKKSFECSNLDIETQIYTIQYLHQTKQYNIEHILKNAKRKYDFTWELEEILDYDVKNTQQEIRLPKAKYTREELIEQVRNKEFYIYGAGIIARELYLLYLKHENGFRGFVVSDGQDTGSGLWQDHPVWCYGEIPKQSVVVIGVSNLLTEEINEQIADEQYTVCLWEGEVTNVKAD